MRLVMEADRGSNKLQGKRNKDRILVALRNCVLELESFCCHLLISFQGNYVVRTVAKIDVNASVFNKHETNLATPQSSFKRFNYIV